VKGRAYIKPISHGDWVDSGKSAQKNKNIDLEELVCAKCWLDKHSLAHDMSKIKEAPKGLVTAVYEEIKYVSGIFKDPFEEKFIERLAKN
jgi:hypothetical protein